MEGNLDFAFHGLLKVTNTVVLVFVKRFDGVDHVLIDFVRESTAVSNIVLCCPVPDKIEQDACLVEAFLESLGFV